MKNLKPNKMGNLPKVSTLGKAQVPRADAEAHIFTCEAVLPRKHVHFYSHLNIYYVSFPKSNISNTGSYKV